MTTEVTPVADLPVAADPSPTQVQVHAISFTIDNLADAVETLLRAANGRQLVQFPSRTIITPGLGETYSANSIAHVESRYSLEQGRMVYVVSVLTLPAAVV